MPHSVPQLHHYIITPLKFVFLEGIHHEEHNHLILKCEHMLYFLEFEMLLHNYVDFCINVMYRG